MHVKGLRIPRIRAAMAQPEVFFEEAGSCSPGTASLSPHERHACASGGFSTPHFVQNIVCLLVIMDSEYAARATSS
jgi:hypothetical protein